MTAPRIWTDAEVDYIKAHYGKKSAPEIAQHLGIDKGQVYSKSRTLGLMKNAPRRNSTATSGIHIKHGAGYRVITHIQPD